jgi:hypothetical protein
VAALPPLVAACSIAKYGVDVPLGHQWRYADMYARRPLVPSWAELTRQENDNIFIIPKLIWAAMSRIDYWNAIREMWLVLAAMAVAGGLLAFLWHRTVSRGSLAKVLPLALASLVLFTPAQPENLLWGIQLIVFIPLVALLLIAATVRTTWTTPVVLGVTALICLVAMCSWSSGLLLWPLCVPLVISARPEAMREWKGWAAWGTCAALSVTWYLRSLHPEPAADPGVTHGQVPRIGDLGGQWQAAAKGFLAFVGSSLSYTHHRWVTIDRFDMAIAVGAAVLLALFVSAAALLATRRTDRLQVLVLWGAVAAYGLGSGALAVMGRFAFGPQYMLSTRYIAFSGPAVIATMALITVALGDLSDRGKRGRAAAAIAGVGLAATVAVLGLRAAKDGETAMWDLHRVRLQGRAALQFREVASDEQLTVLDFTGPRLIRLRAPLLYGSGALVDVRSTIHVHEDSQPGDAGAAGCVEHTALQPDGRMVLSGWAYLPVRHRPADGILITRRGGNVRTPVALATPTIERPDVSQRLNEDEALHTGWAVTAPGPVEDAVAWAYDAERNEAFPLPRSCPR